MEVATLFPWNDFASAGMRPRGFAPSLEVGNTKERES
jgi:hypothetical protein